MCHRRSQHRQANKTMTLHRRRNRKAPRIRDCTTPRHHLCRGHIRKVTRGRDSATAPVRHRRCRLASPSREHTQECRSKNTRRTPPKKSSNHRRPQPGRTTTIQPPTQTPQRSQRHGRAKITKTEHHLSTANAHTDRQRDHLKPLVTLAKASSKTKPQVGV